MKKIKTDDAVGCFWNFFWLLVLIALWSPQTINAQSRKCTDMKEHCVRDVEQQYQQCISECKAQDWDVFCITISDSIKYQKCQEENIKICTDECRKDYHQANNFCYDSYKHCRKGDIFGKVKMEISYKDDVCSAPYVSGRASFTILGFWKYQPSESNEYVKNYRPAFLQLQGLVSENTLVHNEECPHLSPHGHGCPTLLSNFIGGGGTVLPVNPNVDMPHNPLGRLVIYDFPSKLLLPKQLPPSARITPMYRAGHLGEEIRIVGKERPDGDCPPNCGDCSCHCPEYGPAVYKIRFGKFLISADLKSKKDMSGFESWESCGNAIEKTGGSKEFEHEATVSFTVQKDSLSGNSHYDPRKMEPGEDCRNMRSKINVHWDFDLLQ